MQPSWMPMPINVVERPQIKTGSAGLIGNPEDAGNLRRRCRAHDIAGHSAGAGAGIAGVADPIRQLVRDPFRGADLDQLLQQIIH